MDAAEKTKLLAFFNMLKEEDKDIVITMAEALAERYESGALQRASGNTSCRMHIDKAIRHTPV